MKPALIREVLRLKNYYKCLLVTGINYIQLVSKFQQVMDSQSSPTMSHVKKALSITLDACDIAISQGFY